MQLTWEGILLYGALTVVAFAALALGLSRQRPPVFLTRGYPPALKALAPALTPPQKRVAAAWAIPTMLLILGPPLVWQVLSRWTPGGSFLQAWLEGFALLFTFNAVDLLILDGLVFCLWTPEFLVLPGTEGHPAYKDFAFHVRGFLKGVGIVAVVSLVGAVLAEGLALIAGRP